MEFIYTMSHILCFQLHLVHYNLDMYSRASEAACSDKGLSVIGIFLKVRGTFFYFVLYSCLMQPFELCSG